SNSSIKIEYINFLGRHQNQSMPTQIVLLLIVKERLPESLLKRDAHSTLPVWLVNMLFEFIFSGNLL
ncbi:hypothetical protein, partial [Planctobacterium marinum]|uniref:hypothetical protein n=1 Tax=Planctobacterium marinum TaxID=1631968 RepID=UPI00361B712A